MALLRDVESRFFPFLILMAAAFAWYWYAFVGDRLRPRFGEVLLLGIAARAALLFIAPCDDIHRYVWEAEVLLSGGNPYALAPEHPILHGLRDAEWALINHPDEAAVYPPLAQLAFGLIRLLGDSPLLFKAVFALMELPALLLFRALQRTLEAPTQALAVYFLNPLLILEISGRGHFESLLLVFILAFLLALAAHAPWRAAACLGASVLVKVVTLCLVPLALARGPLRAAFPLAAMLAACLALLALSGALANIAGFGREFSYNSILPHAVGQAARLAGHPAAAKPVLAALFAACAAVLAYRLRGRPIDEQGLGWTGLLLFFLPTLHPWYLLWMLPFASLRRSLPWLLLTGTMVFNYYVNYRSHYTGQWQEIHWLRWPQYLPPLILWFASWTRGRGIARR